MELKSGDGYVHNESGDAIKVIEKANGKWYVRWVNKKMQGSGFVMTQEQMKEYVKENYTKKEQI